MSFCHRMGVGLVHWHVGAPVISSSPFSDCGQPQRTLQERWLGLSEQFRAFGQVDFRLDHAATIIGASAVK